MGCQSKRQEVGGVKQVRIIKADSRNFAVQSLETIIPKAKKGEEPGPVRIEWKDSGYFGHRLDHAAKFAISDSFEEGEKITPAMVEKAVAQIVSETQKVLK